MMIASDTFAARVKYVLQFSDQIYFRLPERLFRRRVELSLSLSYKLIALTLLNV